MNARTPLILIGLLTLCVFAFFFTRDQRQSITPIPDPGSEQSGKDESIIGPVLLGRRLQRITFDFVGDTSRLELARVSGRWRVTAPHAFPANARAVDEVLTRLGSLRGQATDAIAEATPDSDALILTHAEGTTRLELGPRLGSGRARLTRGTDETSIAFETSDELHELFEYFNPKLFFANQIDAPLMPETERVEIVTAEQRVVLTQANGRWSIGESRYAERALSVALPGYASIEDYFALAPAIEILEHHMYNPRDGLARFGLDRPLIKVTFSPASTAEEGDDRGTTLRVGVPADLQDQTRFVSYGRTGDDAPAVFIAPTPLTLAFAQDGKAFRDPRLITTPISLIESIQIERPGEPAQRITVEPDGSATLTMDNGSQVGLDKLACITMLVSLIDARATGYVPFDDIKSSPLATVTLSARLDGNPETLTIYDDHTPDTAEPSLLIRRADEPVALRARESHLVALLEANRLLSSP